MINVAKIKSGFNPTGKVLVGFKDSLDPTFAIVDAANKNSLSNYFATDNSYVKIEFLKDASENVSKDNLAFNAMLKDMIETACVNVCNDVFNDQPDFIDRQVMYTFPTVKKSVNTSILANGWYGYRIRPSYSKDIAFKINRIFLEFEGIGTVKICLFSTYNDAPLFSETITINNENTKEFIPATDWVIDNCDSRYYKGEFYLGYLVVSGSFTLKPYDRRVKLGNYYNWPKEAEIYPVYFANHSVVDVIPDTTQAPGNPIYCGLNLDISTYYDYSGFCVQNKQLFAEAINYNLQIQCLRLILSSIRSNPNQRRGRDIVDAIAKEIEGVRGNSFADVMNHTGLLESFDNTIVKTKKAVDRLINGVFNKGITVKTVC